MAFIGALERLVEDGPALALITFATGLLAAALALATALIALIRNRKMGGLGRWVCSLLPIVVLLAFFVGWIGFIQDARVELVGLVQQPRAEAARGVAKHVAVELNGLLIGSTIAAVAGGIVPLAAAVPWTFTTAAGPGRAPTWVVTFTAGLILMGAAAAAAYGSNELIMAMGAVAGADGSTQRELGHEALGSLGTTLSVAHAAIWIVAGLGTVTAAVLAAGAARRGRLVGGHGLVASGAVLLLGTGWFGVTQALADDAVAPDQGSGGAITSYATQVDVPQLSKCQPGPKAPLLEVTRDRVALDGRGQQLDAVSDDLETIKRNWDILHPDRRFAGVVAVAARGSTSIRRLAPWLREARTAGYTNVLVVGERARIVESAVYGDVVRSRPCQVKVTLDPDAPPITRHDDWKALARAAVNSSGPLRVAP